MLKTLEKIRIKEKYLITMLTFIRGLTDGILFVLPFLVSFVCILIYQSSHDNLTLGETIFVINMFNLGVTPLRVFFFALINIFEAKVSLTRINNILFYPDETEEESLLRNDT